jgi:hypothetical protein
MSSRNAYVAIDWDSTKQEEEEAERSDVRLINEQIIRECDIIVGVQYCPTT